MHGQRPSGGLGHGFDIRSNGTYNDIDFVLPPHFARLLPPAPQERSVVMDTDKKKAGWTPRRVVRWAGTISIAVAFFMAIFGAYGFGKDVTPRFLYIYWTIFFLFLMIAVALAMIDALITMAKFRKEHSDLRQMARDAMRDSVEKNQIKAHSTHEK